METLKKKKPQIVMIFDFEVFVTNSQFILWHLGHFNKSCARHVAKFVISFYTIQEIKNLMREFMDACGCSRRM